MRSTPAVLAGLAAVASADLVTVTHTKDVTVTYCAPTVTNCPAGGAQWGNAGVPAYPTGQPNGKPPGGWSNWADVPEAQRTWAEWKAQPSNAWVPYNPVKPADKPAGQWGNWENVPDAQRTWAEWKAKPTNVWVPYTPNTPNKPHGKPPGGWADWSEVPEDQRNWDEWKAKPANEWVPYTPVKGDDKPKVPAGKPPGGWADWKDVPEAQRTWAEWKAQPTNEWVPYTPVKGDDKPKVPAGKPPGGWADWKDVPEAQRTWAEWKAQPTNEWVPYTPVKGDDKPKVPANNANTWAAAPAPTSSCGKYTGANPPEWFKNLSGDALKAMQDKWAAGPPADWCDYSWTNAPVGASATWAGADVKATGTDSKVAKYTGAANANTGSFAMAGLAGLAALLI